MTAPRLLSPGTAEWPAGRALSNDLLVPVVLTVALDGSVEQVELEASVGEPFDSVALQAARDFRFEPARDGKGPRRARIRGVVRFLAVPAVPAGGSPELAPAAPGVGVESPHAWLLASACEL